MVNSHLIYMEKTYRFDLTADQIAVIRTILTMNSVVSQFGGLSYAGTSWEGDACWIELLQMFEKNGANDVKHVNGTFFNRGVNALVRHFNKKHVDYDYWTEEVTSAKVLF